VLINITGGPEMALHEINEAASLVNAEADENANIIFGSVIQQDMEDELKITVIATGLCDPARMRRPRPVPRPDNVTPLRPPSRAELDGNGEDDLTDRTINSAAEPGREEFFSPFEEDRDLEVPAFLRRGRQDS
jgi:cell division protein FtsZ